MFYTFSRSSELQSTKHTGTCLATYFYSLNRGFPPELETRKEENSINRETEELFGIHQKGFPIRFGLSFVETVMEEKSKGNSLK